MIRVWALLFVQAFSVAFLIHRPTDQVRIPHSKEFPLIPGDVFWYHMHEHIIAIIIAVVLLSFFRWPAKKEEYPAFATFFGFQVLDVILFRLFYRNWPIEEVPWNVVKVSFQGVVTLIFTTNWIWKQLTSR
jgi:hypothetical protein